MDEERRSTQSVNQTKKWIITVHIRETKRIIRMITAWEEITAQTLVTACMEVAMMAAVFTEVTKRKTAAAPMGVKMEMVR